jgi:hypothetical protein
MSAETIESAAADADAAPLELLFTDVALGVLNRVNPGGSGLGLTTLAARPRLVALGRGPGKWADAAAVGSRTLPAEHFEL